MAYRIIVDTVADKADILWPLMQSHRDELATHKHLMKLSPDKTKYTALEATGMLLSLLAYEGDELVGYSVGLLANHIHYSDLHYYHNDTLFVVKEHRHSRLGSMLIRETEKQASERGAKIIMWHAKPDTALCRVLEHKEYSVQDIIYSKEL